MRVMLFDDLLYLTEFHPIESSASLQPQRLQPELRNFIFSFHVNVQRFITISSIKEESIWTDP